MKPRITAAAGLAVAIFVTGFLVLLPGGNGNAAVNHTCSATTTLDTMNPSDPSLSKTRSILRAMFIEYGKAIAAEKHHHDPGKYIFRSYGLANFAHDVLSKAKPALSYRSQGRR